MRRSDFSDPARPLPSFRLVSPIVLGAALVLTGCGGDAGTVEPEPEPDPQVATVEVTPGADTLTALGDTRSFTAVAEDADGNEVTGVSFTWSISDESVATVDEAGVVTAAANGTADITASADGITGSAELAVIQQAATVTVSPSSVTLTTVGATQQFSATATDANGNAVEGAVFVWASEDHSVATVDGSGLATSKGSGQASITATAQDIPGHAALTVNQEIDHLAFRIEPTSATAGEAIDPAVQLEVLDSAGNVVEDAEIAITLSLGANPGGGTLGGTKTVNATAGVATFSGLWVDAAATGYTLGASTSGTVTGPESAAFDITVAAAAQLGFTTQPSQAEGREPITPAVEIAVEDEFGNRVTSSAARITVALAADPTGRPATLSGTLTLSPVEGVATFSDLAVDLPADGYTLEATASDLAAATSGPFSVNLTFAQTSAGFDHTCAVTVAEHAYCWGDNLRGQLGDGTTTDSHTPVAVATTESFTEVSAGSQHTCGVTTAGGVLCWGFNTDGQLGGPTTHGTHSSTPVAVATTELFAQVSAGGGHTCGLTTADEAFCWGSNDNGQLGGGTTIDHSSTPVAVDVSALSTGTFAQLNAGGGHTCGVTTADEPFCWGFNYYGQLGDGTNTNSNTPVAVSTQQSFVQLSGGNSHTCGVTTADEPFCWGFNVSGQLGDGTNTNSNTPVAVTTTESFADVSAGGVHSCGVTTANEAFCWGENGDGRLGDGTTTDHSTPVAVASAEPFAQVSAGEVHSCGLTTADEAFCWGANDDGRLGDGTTTDSSTPSRVVQ